MEKRSDNQIHFFMDNIIINNLYRSYVDEPGTSTGPWPRYLVKNVTDKGKSLHNLSPFAIHKGVKSIAGVTCI